MPKNKIEILFRSGNLLAINKPQGVSVTKDRTGAADVIALLRRQLDDSSDIRIIHRLDKDTSGVMLVALNEDTQRRLTEEFVNRRVEKTYLALVHGFMSREEGTVKTPLAPSRKNPGQMQVDPRKGKPAHTEYRRLADFETASLLAVKPVTGRTHQIRVHLGSIGLPLAFDPLYGSQKPVMLSEFKPGYKLGKGKTETPLIERLTLHAYQIKIPALAEMPETPDTFVAPLDKKFAACIKMLTKHCPAGPESFHNPADFDNIIEAKPLCFP